VRDRGNRIVGLYVEGTGKDSREWGSICGLQKKKIPWGGGGGGGRIIKRGRTLIFKIPHRPGAQSVADMVKEKPKIGRSTMR